MQHEKRLLAKKRKSREESTRDSSDEYIFNKKTKSSSDTNSNEHYSKKNINFNIKEQTENFKTKNIVNIIISEEVISMYEYITREINILKEEGNKFSDEPKKLFDFKEFSKKMNTIISLLFSRNIL